MAVVAAADAAVAAAARMRWAALAAAVLAVSCATTDRTGVYSGGDPQVRIYLKPQGRASVQAASLEREVFAEGSWRQLADGHVVIELAGERPQRLVFNASGDLLIATQWDRASWGEAGPGVLYRVR